MRNETLLKLGQKIRYERMKKNLSQEDLADLVRQIKLSKGV